jgi:hypothetical protein
MVTVQLATREVQPASADAYMRDTVRAVVATRVGLQVPSATCRPAAGAGRGAWRGVGGRRAGHAGRRGDTTSHENSGFCTGLSLPWAF